MKKFSLGVLVAAMVFAASSQAFAGTYCIRGTGFVYPGAWITLGKASQCPGHRCWQTGKITLTSNQGGYRCGMADIRPSWEWCTIIKGVRYTVSRIIGSTVYLDR